MHITAIQVQSLDGHTTRGEAVNIYDWTSTEDSQQSKIILKPETLRVVMTAQPAQFAAETVPTQLEFSAETPVALIERLERAGYTEALFVGGPNLLASFLGQKLISQLVVTIEPLVFGAGYPLVEELPASQSLQLTDFQQLNQRGTLLVTYAVLT
jgi:riboflavin biosynthesis pyrimidine reductase